MISNKEGARCILPTSIHTHLDSLTYLEQLKDFLRMDESVSTLGVGQAETSEIAFHSGTSILSSEMLRIGKDGFYVRGKKVPVDDKEAETVYNAFKRWLVESELRRPW